MPAGQHSYLLISDKKTNNHILKRFVFLRITSLKTL